jgi:hypothetical protein
MGVRGPFRPFAPLQKKTPADRGQSVTENQASFNARAYA